MANNCFFYETVFFLLKISRLTSLSLSALKDTTLLSSGFNSCWVNDYWSDDSSFKGNSLFLIISHWLFFGFVCLMVCIFAILCLGLDFFFFFWSCLDFDEILEDILVWRYISFGLCSVIYIWRYIVTVTFSHFPSEYQIKYMLNGFLYIFLNNLFKLFVIWDKGLLFKRKFVWKNHYY